MKNIGAIAGRLVRKELPGVLGLGKPSGSLEKLTIVYDKGKGGRESIEALFNPNKLSLSNSVEWETKDVVGPPTSYTLSFDGVKLTPPTLTVELFFDTYEGDHKAPGIGQTLMENVKGTPLGLFPLAKPNGTSVLAYTEQIARLIRLDKDTHEPPVCFLWWGKQLLFYGALTALQEDFTLFLWDGTPVRATLTCTFTQFTSVGEEQLDLHSADVHKTRTVQRGDTLSSIAAEEYNDPSLWRHIATANGLHNPRTLTPGQVLRVPKLQP